MRELAKPLAFIVRSLKGSEKRLALKNQSTYLEAFLDLLFPFLTHFGKESEDFLLRSVVSPYEILGFWADKEQMEKQVGWTTKSEVFQTQEQAKSSFGCKRQENQKKKKDGQALDGEVVSAELRRELRDLESLRFQRTESRQKEKAGA